MASTGIGSVIGVLNDMAAANIIEQFAIGGAFAAILHNEPISTVDVDIFFFLSEKNEGIVLSLEAVYEYARQHGFEFDHEFINIHGWLIQFVEASNNPLWIEAIHAAQPVQIEDLSVPVITPEYLVAMWLFAGRPKDFYKITAFIEAGIVDREHLKKILKEHNLLIKWEKEKWRFEHVPDEER